MANTYELYNTTAKEIVDVQTLNMNQQEAERYFRHYKQFENKEDFERLYEVRQRENEITNKNYF
mgnify:CR=1 FL=1